MLFSLVLRRAAPAFARVARERQCWHDAPPLALFRVAAARFCAAGARFCAAGARFCVALAARRGRGVLFESCARAGLTAGRARRPGGGVRRRARGSRPLFGYPTSSSPSRDARGDARRATRVRAYPSLESSYRAVVPSPDGMLARVMRSGERLASCVRSFEPSLTRSSSAQGCVSCIRN